MVHGITGGPVMPQRNEYQTDQTTNTAQDKAKAQTDDAKKAVKGYSNPTVLNDAEETLKALNTLNANNAKTSNEVQVDSLFSYGQPNRLI